MRALVAIGDVIQVDHQDGILRGHGTQLVDGELVATVCGTVERVNKLVFVKPLRSRYEARVGDVVIGRVTELAQKRWKVDVNSKQDAHLMLSAVNLPGGIQRRRTATDELNMRSVFVEGDLISAEVQSASQDSIHLHTRSLKYGKLQMGQLVKVEPYLIKRLSQHFHSFGQYQVEVIFGCNGYVWISSVAQREQQQQQLEEDGAAIPIPLATRERICRVGNAVRALASQGLVVSPDSVVAAYEASVGWGIEPKDMLARAFGERLVARENHK
ncbi:hypothetical protein SELMODRAFT_147871 [Selaginella moellendorffii]|uniref:Uncharacterized protein n=1 Tax=Selaginella moellendorffii TaxID=88036 RepID=D8RKE6_SELML|nr:hypothetical protein SELMODRAFT_147871 [Selaginella moellendorffii]